MKIWILFLASHVIGCSKRELMNAIDVLEDEIELLQGNRTIIFISVLPDRADIERK